MDIETTQSEQITVFLERWRDGDAGAIDEMIPLVYEQLRALARYHLRGTRDNHTLPSVAVVHEAYLRVRGKQNMDLMDRNHFFAVAGKVMRNVIREHDRARGRKKRGGDQIVFSLENGGDFGQATDPNISMVNDAVDALEKEDKNAAWVVEMRYFAGLKNEEIADVLGVSVTSVKRELSFARAWLCRYMKGSTVRA